MVEPTRLPESNYLTRFNTAMKTADREIDEFVSRAKLDVQRAENIQRFIRMMAAPVITGGADDILESGERLRVAIDRVDRQEATATSAPVVAKSGK